MPIVTIKQHHKYIIENMPQYYCIIDQLVLDPMKTVRTSKKFCISPRVWLVHSL